MLSVLFNQKSASSKNRFLLPGFTMIELLVVVTIIVVLTTIGLISFQSTTRNARNAKRKADLESIRSALVLYRSDTGAYPTGNGSNVSFESMVSDMYDEDYFSKSELTDPQDEGLFQYKYTSNTITFQVCGYLEPAPGTQYCLNNP